MSEEKYRNNGFVALAELKLISAAPLDSNQNKAASGWGKQISSIVLRQEENW